jgi:hypothetical protein
VLLNGVIEVNVGGVKLIVDRVVKNGTIVDEFVTD